MIPVHMIPHFVSLLHTLFFYLFFLLGKWFATSYVHSLLIDFDIIVSIAKSDVFENFPVHTHGGFAIGFRVHYMSLENALHMTMLRQCMPNPSSSQ